MKALHESENSAKVKARGKQGQQIQEAMLSDLTQSPIHCMS